MNNYEALGIVGEGAYGIVLKCTHKISKEIVAIKKFKDKDTEDSSIKKVLIRELKSLRALRHPNIIGLKDAFRQNERLYLVFEFCEKSLLDVMNSYNPGMPISLIKSVTYQILQAIRFMHEKQFIHRDIKPENILLTHTNRVKICDFGFCRVVNKRGEVLTDYVATRWYRSPELLLHPRYDKSVDLWALGCVIAEMITNEPLFPGDNMLDQLSLIYNKLGKLPVIYKELLSGNRETSSINFTAYLRHPNNYDKDYLKHKYLLISQSPELVDLLEKMLDLDYTSRITAEEALRHPFFHDLPEYKDRENRVPNLKISAESLRFTLGKHSFVTSLGHTKSHIQMITARSQSPKILSKIDINFSQPLENQTRSTVVPILRKSYLPVIKNPKRSGLAATMNQNALTSTLRSKLNPKLHKTKRN